MKKDKKQSIKEMNTGELNKRLTEIDSEIIDARMKLVSGGLKDVHLLKKLRHEMAFIKTILTQRQQTAEAETKQENKE